jgi:hypothetical protein
MPWFQKDVPFQNLIPLVEVRHSAFPGGVLIGVEFKGVWLRR